MEAAAAELRGGIAEFAPPPEPMPVAVKVAFGVLSAVLLIQAAHEIFGFAGSGYQSLIDSYDYDFVTAGACGLIVARGLVAPRERAWLVLGLGTLCWLLGDIVWDLAYGGARHEPNVTASDGLWLLWYPLAAVALLMLLRSRLRKFDLARWIDGIALAIIIATPGVALALQPAIDESHLNAFTHAVYIAYPAFDVLLFGAAVGVIGMASWRPGRTWYLLALGFSMWVVADALYAVQRTDGIFKAGVYDYLWPAGLLLLAAAAWQPHHSTRIEEPIGWKAVALPIACQLFALGTQAWGLVTELGTSERILTIAVLTIVIVQLYVSRPRGGTVEHDSAHEPDPEPDPAANPG